MKILFSTILLVILFLTGCSSDDPAPTPPAPVLKYVYLEPDVLTLDVNTSQEFKATAVYDITPSVDVTDKVVWSLEADNTTLKLNTTIPGLVEAVTAGTDKVIASIGDIQSAGAPVTVVDEILTQLIVSPPSVGIGTGNTFAFKAEGIYPNRTQDLTLESTWTSNNEAKVTMNNNVATGVAVTSQLAIVTASFENLTDTAQVQVYGVLDRVEIVPIIPVLFEGATQQFFAYGYYVGSNEPAEDLTNKVFWTSSDVKVMDLVNTTGRFAAVNEGISEIKAKYSEMDFTATQTVSVAAFIIVNINISPENSIIIVNATREFDVYAVNSDKSQYNLNNTVGLSMQSSNKDLAYFSYDNTKRFWILHAIAPGTLTVNARYIDNRDQKEYLANTSLTIN
ncbi:MAG: hypothetical protein ACC657_09005 [Thiohalomonadales bacterium]